MSEFDMQTLLRMPMHNIPLRWNPVTEAYEPYSAQDTVETRAIKGFVTTQAPGGLTDDTKDFEDDLLNGKIIKVRHGSKDYFREISDTAGGTLTFDPLVPEVTEVPAVESSAVIGASPDGIATIRCKTAGVAGDDYSVEVIAGTGESQSLGVSLTDDLLTITSPTGVTGDPTAILAGNLEALFAGVPAVDAVFSVDDDFEAGEIALTEEPIAFSGGSDTVAAIPAVIADEGDAYEVLPMDAPVA